MTPSFALAFLAGLLSFLSPCVLPLVPSYVGFLTGLTLEELEIRRGTALVHALWFVAGSCSACTCSVFCARRS